MFKYTQSAILDTFDLIKRLIFISVIIIQISYMGYIGFRIYYNMGLNIINYGLLVLSIIYFVYYIVTEQEFYTENHKRNRFTIKWIFKSIKYGVSLYLLVVAIMELVKNQTTNNLSLLVVVLMIISIILNILFDIIIILIDQQITIINSSVRYDMEVFRTNNKLFTLAMKKMGFDIEEKFPPLENEKLKQKIVDINYHQEQKLLRKKSFFSKYKKM